jgi:glycosyltransferase involved in cell wall biosynthesis
MASINLIARDNGFGLSRDLRLLAAALTARGHAAALNPQRRGKLRKWFGPWKPRVRLAARVLRGLGRHEFDANLMLEHVRPEWLALARHNVMMPNPDWFLPSDAAALAGIDCVFAKTRLTEEMFAGRGCRVVFTGFTSEDRYLPDVARRRAFFHLAGRSTTKNTESVLALWRKHPEWPLLTVVQDPRTAQPGAPAPNIDHRVGRMDDAELRRLQNEHRFHLCPSQAEGFGHYLVEAMSAGAVTLTLDAAPMNELITPERGVLVPVARTAQHYLATLNFFDDAAMEQAVERLIGLSDAECERLGGAARDWFVANDHAFPERLDAAISSLD